MGQRVSTIARRGYPPQLYKPHLLSSICRLEELDLRRREAINVNTMPGEYDLYRELISLGRFRGRPGWLLRGYVGGMMVVLGDGVYDGCFHCRRLLYRSNIVVLERKVPGEEGCQLILGRHGVDAAGSCTNTSACCAWKAEAVYLAGNRRHGSGVLVYTPACSRQSREDGCGRGSRSDVQAHP
jgi:hypothetical protein